MIHFTPYRTDKDLGRAYNDVFRTIPAIYTICLRDIDTMFLTPQTPAIIERYSELHPEAILTCYTNRVGCKDQLINGVISANRDISYHITLAEQLERKPMSVTEIPGHISGMLMVVPFEVWFKLKFKEGIGCLGVDTDFTLRAREQGIKILRMNAVYVWHTYRLKNGIKYKKHLL